MNILFFIRPKKKIILFSIMFLFSLYYAQAQFVVDAGTGWSNLGISPSTTWKPYTWSQGSRKEVPALIQASYLGKNKIYYSPFIRLQYTNAWSMTGAINLMDINIGAVGMGIYLWKNMGIYTQDERTGKWFGTFEMNLSVAFGGNLTPNQGSRGSNSGNREWENPNDQFGNQYYPFKNTYESNKGIYNYMHLSIPIKFRFWKMITSTTGIGFFIGTDLGILEKSFTYSHMPWAIGYNLYAGISLTSFK